MTSRSMLPNISRSRGLRRHSPASVTPREIVSMVSTTCLAARLQPSRSPPPRYWEQRMDAPAAMAENIWITRLLMESTRETAEMASLPTLLTIMVSTMPIREFSSCSTTMGIRSAISAPEGYSIFSLSIWLLSYKRLLSPLARIIPLPRH